jgi:hypothetical protein
MDSQSIKLELIKLLLETDEPTLLEKVRQLLLPTKNGKSKKSIVGFKPNDEPLSQADLEAKMAVSIKQADNSEVISHEDLLKEAENW